MKVGVMHIVVKGIVWPIQIIRRKVFDGNTPESLTGGRIFRINYCKFFFFYTQGLVEFLFVFRHPVSRHIKLCISGIFPIVSDHPEHDPILGRYPLIFFLIIIPRRNQEAYGHIDEVVQIEIDRFGKGRFLGARRFRFVHLEFDAIGIRGPFGQTGRHRILSVFGRGIFDGRYRGLVSAQASLGTVRLFDLNTGTVRYMNDKIAFAPTIIFPVRLYHGLGPRTRCFSVAHIHGIGSRRGILDQNRRVRDSVTLNLCFNASGHRQMSGDRKKKGILGAAGDRHGILAV
ncbi:MAG TPA: hypothetical protein PKH10_06005, partial [bacterium]|nr:hypothetical protein [bacterium]